MKLLIASDLHYVKNLADEIARNQHRLSAGTYNHQVDGKLYWHNQMMVEEGERLLDGRIVQVDHELAATSLQRHQEGWTAGEAADREFTWPPA